MTEFLLLAFVFLIAGVISVPIATRLGLGSVLGYLIAGIVISPLLGWLGVDVISIQHFAEFGVVMMLFLVGLELEPRRLWDMRGRLFGLGGLQVGLTTLVVMAVSMMFFDQVWSVALAVGLIFALSSTAIVLQTLQERKLMGTDGGQSSFSVLLFQDIAVIPMLAFLPLLALPELVELAHHGAEHGDDHHGSGITLSLVAGLNEWQAAIVTFAAIAAVVGIGRLLVGPIFRFIAYARMREIFTATALMLVIGISLLMSLVGLSPALGAFLGGVVLANSEYRHELESDIDPFRGLLLGLFFITVGAGINFELLFGSFAEVLRNGLLIIGIKFAVLMGLAFLFKIKGRDRWLFALSLAQAGEFGFVLIAFTLANGVIPRELADQLLLVVALSMLLTPLLFILFDQITRMRFSNANDRPADEINERGTVLIAGHGRFGGIVNRMMRGAGHPTVVVDYSAEQVEYLRQFGLRAYYGDATRPDLLKAAGIDDARVLVVAIDDKDAITGLVRYACKTYPHLKVVARSYDRYHTYKLWSVGCREIIRETYDSSLRAGRTVFEALGESREDAQRMTDIFEEHDRSTMVELADLFEDGVTPDEDSAYTKRTRELLEEWEQQLRGRLARDDN